MKKIIISLLIIGCVMMVGCNKKDDVFLKTEWNNNLTIMDDEIINIFDKAKDSYNEKKLNPIALLATQVVAGTNYMFLCEGTDFNNDTIWVVVIVYQDLQGNAKITKVQELKLSNYYEKDNKYQNDVLAGGWTIYDETKPTMLINSKAQEMFDKAIDKLVDINYYPITLLGETENSYLVLTKKVFNNDFYLSVLTIQDNQ